MKTFRYKFGLLLSFLAIAAMTSCSEEEADYTPAEKAEAGAAQVFFTSENPQQIDLAQDATSFDIMMSRAEAGPAATYKLEVTADSLGTELFEFPTTVEFADKSKTATYTVNIKEGKVLEYEVYSTITISVAKDDATPYGIASYTAKVGVPAPWSEWEQFGTGTYTLSGYWAGTHSGLPIYYREYLLNDTDAQFYIPGIANSMDLTIDYNRQTGICTVLPQYAATNSNYGQVTVTDIPNYPFTNVNPDDFEPSRYDEEKGLFTLNLAYVVCTLWNANTNGSFGTCTETFQLDGFKQYDYSFSMEFKGHYVDAGGNDNAVISAVKGVDISKYLITIIGEDEDPVATASGMIDGSVACETLKESGFFAKAIEESGKYTAVAVTFDADGNVIEEIYTTTFEFFKVGEENPWVSLGMAMYTEDCLTTFFDVPNETYPVEVREHKDNPGLYRIIHPYAAYGADTSSEYFIEIDARDPEGVYIPGYYGTGLDVGYGEVGISSVVYYYMDKGGEQFDALKDNGFCGILADNVITFPAGSLLISMANYQSGGWYGSNINGAFRLDMNDMQPVGSVTARVPSIRNYVEQGIKDVKDGKYIGINLKKIDNSFMTPVEAELK